MSNIVYRIVPKRKYRIVVNDWTPSLHPRDDDGKFTEAAGTLASAVRDLVDAGDRDGLHDMVQESTGVDSVNLPDLDDDDMVQFTTALTAAGESGLTENVDVIDTNTPGDAFGVYNFNENRLSFRREMSTDDLDGQVEEGYAVGENMEWLVLHELGHAQHQTELGEGENPFDVGLAATRDGEWVGRERVDTVDETVSAYARSNAGEMVAEVFAGRAMGEEFPDEVMEMYEEWDGPDSWQEYTAN